MRGAMASGAHSIDEIDPRELARIGGSWSRKLSLAGFERVAASVVGQGSFVDLNLDFSFDERGHCRVQGSAQLTAGLLCQRCMRTIDQNVEALVDVLIVKNEADARNLTPEYDTFVLSGREISVEELVEDDILLSLPQQACDQLDDCPHTPELEYPLEEADKKLPASPFAVLAAIRSKAK